MRRLSSVGVLVLGTLLWSVQPAYADFWDWLQEFSGPGPFHERFFNVITDVCPGPAIDALNHTDKHLLRDFEVPEEDPGLTADTARFDPGQHVTCFFADARWFVNNDNDNFGVQNIRVDIYEVGASARLHRAIALGFGGGLMRISTPGHTAYQPVLTGPRVVIKPALLFGSNTFWARHPDWYYLAGLVKYYFKEQIVLGHVTGPDFGLKSGNANFAFDVSNDRQASTGFTFDASDLVVAVVRKWKR